MQNAININKQYNKMNIKDDMSNNSNITGKHNNFDSSESMSHFNKPLVTTNQVYTYSGNLSLKNLFENLPINEAMEKIEQDLKSVENDDSNVDAVPQPNDAGNLKFKLQVPVEITESDTAETLCDRLIEIAQFSQIDLDENANIEDLPIAPQFSRSDIFIRDLENIPEEREEELLEEARQELLESKSYECSENTLGEDINNSPPNASPEDVKGFISSSNDDCVPDKDNDSKVNASLKNEKQESINNSSKIQADDEKAKNAFSEENVFYEKKGDMQFKEVTKETVCMKNNEDDTITEVYTLHYVLERTFPKNYEDSSLNTLLDLKRKGSNLLAHNSSTISSLVDYYNDERTASSEMQNCDHSSSSESDISFPNSSYVPNENDVLSQQMKDKKSKNKMKNLKLNYQRKCDQGKRSLESIFDLSQQKMKINSVLAKNSLSSKFKKSKRICKDAKKLLSSSKKLAQMDLEMGRENYLKYKNTM